jgi:hypothetical protein
LVDDKPRLLIDDRTKNVVFTKNGHLKKLSKAYGLHAQMVPELDQMTLEARARNSSGSIPEGRRFKSYPRNQLYLLSNFSHIGRPPRAAFVFRQAILAVFTGIQLGPRWSPIGPCRRGFPMGDR